MGEIRRLQQRLRGALCSDEVLIAPLYGDLDNAAQDRAIEPPPPGKRKVVLATSIAETSLTIEGIRVVVDVGEMRVPRFDPVSGMSRLSHGARVARLRRSAPRPRRAPGARRVLPAVA